MSPSQARPRNPVLRFLRDNSLSLFFFAIFAASLAGQAAADYDLYTEEQIAHAQLEGERPELISFGRYLASSDFAQAVTENWQSEYLQFVLFVLTAVWLIQRGSPESSKEDDIGGESDEQQKVGRHADADSPLWARVGGWRTGLYSNSLVLLMLVIFLGSWFAQSVSGWSMNNADQIEHGQAPLRWVEYIGSSHFWATTLQNWQSEFLAVGSMAIFAVYLRQRGSAQSKPVGSPHHETGDEG